MARHSEQLEKEADEARARLSQTLDELRLRVSPASVMDQLGQSGAGEFFTNLARDVRENPLALAFLGASFALLMAPRLRDNVSDVLRRGGKAAGGLAERAQSAMGLGGDSGPGPAWSVSRAGDAAAAWGESASGGYRQASAAGGGMLHGFVSFCREQPLVVAGIGLGIGAGLGALMALGGGSDSSAVPLATTTDQSQEYVAAEQARMPEELPEPLLGTGGGAPSSEVHPTASVEAVEGLGETGDEAGGRG